MQVAIKNEVLVAISNRNYAGPGNMLATWMDNVKRAGVSNALVVALDKETKAHVTQAGLPAIQFNVQVILCLQILRCCLLACSAWSHGLLQMHFPARSHKHHHVSVLIPSPNRLPSCS